MTDKHAGYVVTLEKDIYEDDAQAVINALRMISGVISVKPIISEPEMMIAQDRAMFDVRDKFWEFYKATFR